MVKKLFSIRVIHDISDIFNCGQDISVKIDEISHSIGEESTPLVTSVLEFEIVVLISVFIGILIELVWDSINQNVFNVEVFHVHEWF